jgi:glycosyltransferase involved in cell wall biosynthesis
MKKNNTREEFPQLFKVSVIIPALNPPKTLIELVHDLKTGGIQKIVVINDGSSKDYKEIFDKVSEMGATVLKHPINRGLGAAIKTGVAYVEQNHLSSIGVITVDCDGQHATNDVIKMATILKENPGSVVLGVRHISLFKLPLRSFIGNFFAKIIFLILKRKRISDTQCGLRAFPISLVPHLLSLSGQKFEYITQMLVYLVRSDTHIIQTPVETIYAKHIGSHFRPIVDSWAIIKALVK